MAQAIAYKDVALHCRRNDAQARLIRRALEDMEAKFIVLEFDDPTEDLKAVTTWFDGEPNFADMPVLTYREVFWQDPDDPTHDYGRTCFALTPGDLPEDFAVLSR